MKKILLIGTIPPPIGGVSMHIQRFVDCYENHEDFYLDVLDLKKQKLYRENRSVSFFEIIKVIKSASIVHLHLSSNLKLIIALFSKMLGKKVVYTHHNIRINSKIFFRLLMLFTDKLILVNDMNIDQNIKKKYDYSLIPAFLPSVDETKLPMTLEKELNNFKYIISTNCFEMTFIDGKDLYGFDLCVDSFSKLVDSEVVKDTLLVLVDPSGTSKLYVENLLSNFKINNNCKILFVGYHINFNALIEKSTVVLRATRSDGDSLTVREALYMNVPIIASDVTVRPLGTICFRNEDNNDLSKAIYNVLINNEIKKIDAQKIDFGEKILDIYDSI